MMGYETRLDVPAADVPRVFATNGRPGPAAKGHSDVERLAEPSIYLFVEFRSPPTRGERIVTQ